MKVQNIAIGLLRINPHNPRDFARDQDIDTLAASIAQSGILVPLIVRKAAANDDKPAGFEVLAGHRRLMAAEGVLDELPCIVTAEDQGDGRVLALIENTQRVNLSAIEEAHAIAAALAGGMKQKELATAIGKAPSHVSKMMKIIKAEKFLTDKGTDATYFGDYTNAEELYEHAREVLGEVKPPAQVPLLPTNPQEPKVGDACELTDEEALIEVIEKHAADAKVKKPEVTTEMVEGRMGATLVSIQFKNMSDAEKFFLSYTTGGK